MNSNTKEIRQFASKNFETLKYIISNESNDILLDNAYRLDLYFFSMNVSNLDTSYISTEDFHYFPEKTVTDLFSILLVNIQSIEKNFENLKILLSTLESPFSDFQRHGSVIWIILHIICLTTQVPNKKRVISKVGKYLSTLITLLIPKLDLTIY